MTSHIEFRGRENEATTLTLDALQAALASCMAANPPQGPELRLHKDAKHMANLFGVMVYERMTSVFADDVDTAIIDAYKRWARQ